MQKSKKILALSLVVMLLLMGCYSGTNSTQAESTVEFPFSKTVAYSSFSIVVDMYFDFSVDHSGPSLLFGGTDTMYINLQPETTTFSVKINWGSSSKTFTETFAYTPIGDYTFLIPISEVPGINGILVMVSAYPWVLFQSTGGLGVQANYVDPYNNPVDVWESPGRHSVRVTAPSGIGSSTIRENWYYYWGLSLGVDTWIGEFWLFSAHLGSLEGTILNISVSYGYGFLFLFFILIMIVLVVVIVAVKKKRKKVPPTPTPPTKPITPIAVTPDTVEEFQITEIKKPRVCPNCGSEIDPEHTFCPHCGTQL